ncbi:Cytosolic sulfotransferase 15, partial [Mucuna pruriens]
MASTIGQHESEDKLILSLRKERGWAFPYLYLFQEFWCPPSFIQEINLFQKYFEAKESDVIVASFPKSGTTWLKALTFAVVNHQRFSIENHPLLTSNPHDLVDPLPALTLEEAFEMYCNGIIEFGPWWSHMLGYWKESIGRPNKVLFLKYEDLKENVNFHVKKVAEFLGCPFSEEEENNGIIESIIKLCSFEKMKDLEVNKSGKINFKIKTFNNKLFFRKAEIGDWRYHKL